MKLYHSLQLILKISEKEKLITFQSSYEVVLRTGLWLWMCVRYVVDWCEVKEWSPRWKVEQVIVGDHGLAPGSDLDSGPDRCRRQRKMGHSLFVVLSFPVTPQDGFIRTPSCVAGGPVCGPSHRLFSQVTTAFTTPQLHQMDGFCECRSSWWNHCVVFVSV